MSDFMKNADAKADSKLVTKKTKQENALVRRIKQLSDKNFSISSLLKSHLGTKENKKKEIVAETWNKTVIERELNKAGMIVEKNKKTYVIFFTYDKKTKAYKQVEKLLDGNWNLRTAYVMAYEFVKLGETHKIDVKFVEGLVEKSAKDCPNEEIEVKG